MFNKWIDRFNNELELQKQLGTEIISMRFTRKEVIELRVCMNTLKELDDIEKIEKTEDFCEWKLMATTAGSFTSNHGEYEKLVNVEAWDFCPYCGKKIKIIY